jgi:predicted nucleic acid-binding protein
MASAVFVDTNVLLHALDVSEPAKQSAAVQWLERLWRDGSGRISTQVLAEYYFNASRKVRFAMSPELAWNQVRALAAWKPLANDYALMERGRDLEQRFQLNWWDSLIVAAAQLQECSVLLSEDMQDGLVCDGVVIRNPFAPGAHEVVAGYGPGSPGAAVTHPPRGRPRKTAVR